MFGAGMMKLLSFLLLARHKSPNEIGDFIGRGVEGEMSGFEDVNLGLWHITSVRFGFGWIE
jgi:hypothetical protein